MCEFLIMELFVSDLAMLDNHDLNRDLPIFHRDLCAFSIASVILCA